jgi:dolichol-phosphate mannosyltransferase
MKAFYGRNHISAPLVSFRFAVDSDKEVVTEEGCGSFACARAGNLGLDSPQHGDIEGRRMPADSPELQVLLPIHNEAASIAATVREIFEAVSLLARPEFLLCEDGSKDNTKQILRELVKEVPARLLLSDDRKGYARAVRDGMLEMEAPYLLCLDSDGQCDPQDFRKFWENRNSADVLIGWRVQRADTLLRRAMSRTFFLVWKCLYHVQIHDPSCPLVLARKEVIHDIAAGMGAMPEGFWWEFSARVSRLGYTIQEFPVHHRRRAAGVTQVYRLRKLPGIGYRHFLALFRIFRETRAGR